MTTNGEVCGHYKRNCKLVCPSCNNAYRCRFCHDDKEDHKLNRQSVKIIKCVKCELKQPVSNECINDGCGTIFGEAYFCKICVLFDNEDRQQFHCDGCGLCRVGGRENFIHCEKCKMCLGKNGSHKCIDEISLRNCAVCLEDIHTSRLQAHVPKCSHLMHFPCFEDFLKSGNFACPTCGICLTDMKKFWHELDEEIEMTPMPVAYSNKSCEVICKDCHKTTTTKYHCIGLKCTNCGSYNTTQTKAPLSDS